MNVSNQSGHHDLIKSASERQHKLEVIRRVESSGISQISISDLNELIAMAKSHVCGTQEQEDAYQKLLEKYSDDHA